MALIGWNELGARTTLIEIEFRGKRMSASCEVSELVNWGTRGRHVKCVERNHVTMYANKQLTLSILESHSRSLAQSQKHGRLSRMGKFERMGTFWIYVNIVNASSVYTSFYCLQHKYLPIGKCIDRNAVASHSQHFMPTGGIRPPIGWWCECVCVCPFRLMCNREMPAAPRTQRNRQRFCTTWREIY